MAKTADRGVLGCMNDMAFLCEVAISHADGLAHCDPVELNQALHRNINSSRAYRPPVELAAQRLVRGNQADRTRPRAGATQLVTLRLPVQCGRHHVPLLTTSLPKHSVAADMHAVERDRRRAGGRP